ncbi:basic secretory protein-like protein [Actinokineospora sp.]|uniref:basic secretory protein-like protein n=1 Tax=Actinokineospora sp. TaxID=1872133 RepID=UPI004037B6D7
MARRARVRAWLCAAVAVAALGGVALVSAPAPVPPPPGQSGQGQPLGAAAPEPPPVGPADAERADAITALLARRADAMVNRDEAAFVGTLDPQADPTFLETQRELYANLATVPLDAWSYLVHPDDTLDLSTLPDPAADLTAAELWAPGVELRYALRGIDRTPTTRAMGYLFVRRGEQWFLRSDTALGDLGRRTWRGPWDFGPCQVTTTAHGLVLAHPGSQPMVDRLVRELDSSVRSVTQVWGAEWPQRVALFLPDSPTEMRAMVGPDFPVESVVAVAIADRVDTAAGTATGQRVVLSPMGSRALSVASLRVVLRHEITHVAARVATVDGSPMWLLEGFADYVGYRDSGIGLAQGAPDLARMVRESGPPGALPEDRSFRGKDRELDLAYQQAWSIARFLAERFGEAKLVETYRALAGAGPVSAGETDDLLRRSVGLDRAGVLREWQAHLRGALR